jgi:hypothetical protein
VSNPRATQANTLTTAAATQDNELQEAFESLSVGDEVAMKAGNSLVTQLSREHFTSLTESVASSADTTALNPSVVNIFVSGIGAAPAFQVLEDLASSVSENNGSNSNVQARVYWDVDSVSKFVEGPEFAELCEQLGPRLTQTAFKPAAAVLPRYSTQSSLHGSSPLLSAVNIVAGPPRFVSDVKAGLQSQGHPVGTIICVSVPAA